MQLYLDGRCDEAARRFAVLSADHPEVAGLASKAASCVETPAPSRRGFLLLPSIGVQFPVHAVGWISTGFRFGILAGGHLSERTSLGFEPAVATWSTDYCGGRDFCVDLHRSVELDGSMVLLRHAGWSRGQIVFGPKLGWTFILRHNPEERTFPYVVGVQMGAKAGAFLDVTRALALGAVVDLAYVRAIGDWTSTCYSDEPDCKDMWNTFVGSVSLAALF
jgi:hypothetical protein